MGDRLLPRAGDAAWIVDALESERPTFTPPPGVTGITVPHHLLAPDLIARGFWAASAGEYDRVILVTPDHFHAVSGMFATTLSDFATPFGPVAVDAGAVDALRRGSASFALLPDMAGEHGVHALTPFVRRFWPQARLVPVLAPPDVPPEAWEALARTLLPLVTARTLLVQSTDFSHYLPLATAVRLDQQSLAVIAAGEPHRVRSLVQPAHVDSKASQFVQMAVQDALGAGPVVLANRNSAEYGAGDRDTTSYVVAAYLRDPAAGARFRYADQDVVYFGGDTLLGRNLTRVLRDPRATDAIVAASRAVTGDAPLVLNLEGVMLEEVPSGLPPRAHLMLSSLAVPVLQRLGVRAVSLANNHSHDLGFAGVAETERVLRAHGIAAIRHGRTHDLGPVRVLALGFVAGGAMSNPTVTGPADLDGVCATPAAPPLAAFVHWGREYVAEPGPVEIAAARRLEICGVSLVVGAHSHTASRRVLVAGPSGALMVGSLGNFLFDQHAPRSRGALLEMRIFRQGTIAGRLIPLPNLYETGVRARTAGQPATPHATSAPTLRAGGRVR